MPKRSAAELHYDASWESAPQGRPLSLSLPFQPGNLALRGKNRHYRLQEIQRRHFNAMAVRCGVGAD